MATIDLSTEPALDGYVDETRRMNELVRTAQAYAPSFDTPEGLARLREGDLLGAGTVDEAEDRDIPGPAGPIPVRVLVPPRVDSVMLFLHGGGWCIGDATGDETGLWSLAQASNTVMFSINYRLAPEHPFPAGPDDCEAAALWLLERAEREFGTPNVVIGGGSAGAHLSALTLLRLRDRHDAVDGVRAANLVAGAFDLGMTPSQRAGADALIIPRVVIEACYRHFLPEVDGEGRRDPSISPLYADLSGMPPALFTVGTLDPLLDDSLFLAARWRAAGSEAELAVYPESIHGFAAFPTEMARAARTRMAEFIRRRVAA
jgi:acetyl esterase/lipase